MNKIKLFFTNTIKSCIYAIAGCVPVRKEIIVFASFPDFSDNSWALFKYLKDNRTDLKLYWYKNQDNSAIPDETIKSRILYEKNNLFNKIRNHWILSRAGFLFGTHGIPQPKKLRQGQIRINLSHGPCPIKGAKDFGISHPSKEYKIIPNCEHILVQSEGCIRPSAVFYMCDEKYLLPLGMMRNDFLINNVGEGKHNPFYDGKSDKLIIWMPTFRESIESRYSEMSAATQSGLPLLSNEKLIEEFNEFLLNKNVQILVKIHPLQKENPIFSKSFSNITFLTNESIQSIGKQIYEVIGYSDAMLLDYSSVYFDYLITNKPVGFILDDLKEYDIDRGFVFDDPRYIMAGHHIYNIDELKKFVKDIFNGEDLYLDNRLRMKNNFVGDIPESYRKRFTEYFRI